MMKSFLRLAVCLICVSHAALADDAPFAWPASFSYTSRLTSVSHPGKVFINIYRRDGQKARDENPKLGVMIFRLDEHKRYNISPAGDVKETDLPPDWQMSNIFPKGRPWDKIGNDTVNGQPAVKYSIARDPYQAAAYNQAAIVTFWLSPDGKTPIRMEDGDNVLDFSDYVVGPQDAKLFEPPAKK